LNGKSPPLAAASIPTVCLIGIDLTACCSIG